jgi:hypothetical protein
MGYNNRLFALFSGIGCVLGGEGSGMPWTLEVLLTDRDSQDADFLFGVFKFG